MMLLDSNIIIYAAKPEHAFLRQLIAENAPAVSAVSLVEVLGFHKLSDAERQHFEAFFAASTVLPLSGALITQAEVLSGCFAVAGEAKVWSGLDEKFVTR